MGVPSVVCYLLMATLMGSLLSELGVIPLAAHLFIFYFGMMSMVTPPVALAAYAQRRDLTSQDHADRSGVFSLLVGRLHSALHVHLPSGLAAHGRRWRRPLCQRRGLG